MIKQIIIFPLLLLPLCLQSGDREALNFFENKVRPLLAAECYDCHGPDKAKGDLRVDNISHILKGGSSGPALVIGKPEESLLIEAVHRTDPDFAMPPKTELSKDQVAVLEKWVREGAVWPKDEIEESPEVDQFGFTEEDYQWWAIQPVKDPSPPKNGAGWATNEIDHFIARKLEAANLQPAAEASREELIRRAYFDLHGLPPSPEQVEAFVNDDRPDAWPRLIDELLASPAYGERWAQHWLDVVRYAESDGYRADGYRPETYRYRDYVVNALNEDKPYNQFVREQLAGDEIAPEDPDTVVATAFLRLGIYEWNQRNARMHWDLIMTEMTNATAEAFLGIGIGCAQCHDHKFDPILQKDHFALQAFLNTVWWPENQPLAEKDDLAKLAEWEKATAGIRAKLDELQKARVASSLKFVVKQFPEDIQAIYNKPQEERNAYEEQLAQLVQRQVDHDFRRIDWKKTFAKDKAKLDQYNQLTSELKEFDHLKPKNKVPNGFIATDAKCQPADTVLEKRGKKEVIEPAFLTLLGQPAPEIKPGKNTTGRRTVLADWIASDSNPLSTRVMANRIWQRHFKNGLAPSPNDFGKLGGVPTHPELLDWLTSRFVEGGWKMKDLHRKIMTSSTYRQTARRKPTSVESLSDPGNELLWRYPPKRLQAEQVRDAMLKVSGDLTPKSGGPSQGGSATIRSVYIQKKRNSPDPFLGSFDAPSGFASSPSRIPTTTPNQSLFLVNSEWPMKRARSFARRILQGKSQVDREVIQTAFQHVYGRDATDIEIDGSIDFINRQLDNVTGTVAPPPKYPNETGLRDIKQYFGEVKDVDLGKNSLWLQPGSRFERLDFSSIPLPEESFTIEAVANLDSIYKDASVNTLISKWNGSTSVDGWGLGVTSEKSRYQPRNFIMQLVGENFQQNQVYEVVASDLRLPLQKPVYLAASVSARPTDGDATSGKINFYLKDLSNPKAELQTSEVVHSIVGGFPKQTMKSLIGGRVGSGHLWDGQLARLRISDGHLEPGQLLINKGKAKTIIDWSFSSGVGEKPEENTSWYRAPLPQNSDSKLLSATTDFCHALFNSNEFLYLH